MPEIKKRFRREAHFLVAKLIGGPRDQETVRTKIGNRIVFAFGKWRFVYKWSGQGTKFDYEGCFDENNLPWQEV